MSDIRTIHPNVIGYVIVERWRGTQPSILGRLRERSLQEENLALLQARLAPNSSVTYELAAVSATPDGPTLVPAQRVELPSTKWWDEAA